MSATRDAECCRSSRSNRHRPPPYSLDSPDCAPPARRPTHFGPVGTRTAPAPGRSRRSVPRPTPLPSAPRGRGSLALPTAAASRPASVSIPDALASVDTSSSSGLPTVPPTTRPARSPSRCPRTSGHPPPACRDSLGNARRLRPVHLVGTTCRTAGRTGTLAHSSLWHATLLAASQPLLLEVPGSSPISRLLAAFPLPFEPRPLPSTGITRLRRYYRPFRLLKPPGLSLAGVRFVAPSTATRGLPCSVCSLCPHAVAPTPASLPSASFVHVGSVDLPHRSNGSALALRFSRLAWRSLALRPADSRNR